MFRRSRFNIRPNVGMPGRTVAAPQESPSASQEASENPKNLSESCTGTAVTDKSAVTQSEKATAVGDGNDQNGEGTSSSAAVQRRKRFSIKPKVAPGRPSSLARVSKSPVKAVSKTPVEVPVSELDKPATSSQTGTTAAPIAPKQPWGLQSPRRQRPSEESKQPKMQPKPILIPSDSSEPSVVPTAEDSPKQACVGVHRTNPPVDSGKEFEGTSSSQVEEVPSRLPEIVPPSLPDKDAIEISEKARTLVSSKSGLSLSLPAFSLSRLLNDPSDLQRLAKARKLRELLKQEMHKEKKIKKPNTRAKECTLDPTKMTMRDLIRYLPLSNPMSTSLEESAQENETVVVPPSSVREVSPERVQEPEVPPKIASPRAEEEVEAEEEQDDNMMVPQVKVAEDGSLIIDEESLTVEVQRAKGPNSVQDRDPIFERGSTTTYSSFRKGTYSKPWSNEETDMFFLAISMVGTDFSMICQLFPHRARSEIKNKFKKEERENSWRIDKAFRERRKLDIEYFSKLLEKILEVQKNRKKLKSLAGKISPKKQNRKAKGKKSVRKLSVVEEEDEEEQTEMPDLEEEEEEEGEKENEDFCNEGGTTVAKPKMKRKKDASTEEPNDKKKKMGEKSNEQDEAYISEVTEEALPEDCPTSDMSEKTDGVNEAKDITIKPAKLSQGRAPRPLLPLGRKWGKKIPPPSIKTNDTPSDKGDVGNKDASPLRQANNRKSANDDSEEEDATVQLPRPTRYGRLPKLNKPLNYAAKESGSETTAASPAGFTASAARPKPKCTAKRGRSSKQQSAQESKKPKLVTLRASQSEYSDEEDEQQHEEEAEVEEEQHTACSSNKDSTAPVFVPASLQSRHPVISEVEETMEELDILANMPDVLGISQDALCPDASCELAQNEAGTAEPCEHQLDLLVDVIDFLASDHTEVTEDESYNEAAQTLLTIGNLAHLSQSAQKQITIQNHITETTSVSVNDTSQHLEEKNASQSAAQEKNSAPPLIFAAAVNGVTETLETVTTVEMQNSARDNDDIPIVESNDQRASSDIDPIPQLLSSTESSKTDSPQTRRGRLSKVKPKPDLGQASRTTQPKSHLETLTVRMTEQRHTAAPDPSQATEIAAEKTSKIADCNRTLLKDEISCVKVKHAEEPSGSQTRSVGQVKSDAATSDQSASEKQIHNFSEAQFEPSLEQATIHSRPTSRPADEVLMSHVESSDLKVSESQIGQGSNIDTVPVHKSNYHCVTPVEELPVSQKEESEVGPTRQTRTSRFQTVKPNVNLAQTLRTAHSKPHTTKYTTEKHSNQTPNPKFYEKTVAEPTCTTSPEKPSQSPASDLITSLDLGTTLTPTEVLSPTKERKKGVRLVAQVESGAATLHQSASESQNIFEAQFQPSMNKATIDTMPILESTDEKPVRTTKSSSPTTSDSAVTVSQVGQGSNIDSAPVQESPDHPAPCVKTGEELLVSHKEESEVRSTCPTRMSRFQRVRPKVNVTQTLRTARSKPQTTKETTEKDYNPTPNPRFYEKTVAEVEAEPTCTTSPKKTSQSPGPASDLISSLDLGYTLTPTEELSTTEEKKTDVGESNAVTSEQSASETQNLSKAQFESSMKQATRDRTPTLESTEEKRVGTTLSTTDSAVTEPQVGQGSPTDSAPVQESIDHLASCVTPVDQLPVSQKEESKVKSTCQTTRGQLQNAKSNLSQMTRTVRSKPQSTKDPVAPMHFSDRPSSPTSIPEFTYNTLTEVEAKPTGSTTPSEKPSQIISTNTASLSAPSELCSAHKTTEELSSTKEQKTDVGCGRASNSEGPEQNIPQRRRRFAKVKPNLGSFPRTTRTTKLQSNDSSKPSEQCHMDTSLSSEQQFVDSRNEQTQQKLTDSKHLTHSSLHTELLTSTKLQDSTNDEGTSSDGVIIATSLVAENQSVLTESVLQNKRSEKPTVGGESIEDITSNNDMVEAGPSSQWDCKQDMSIRTPETNTQPTDDPTAVSDPQKSLEDGSTESNTESTLPTNTQSISDPKENTQQPQSKNESEAQIQDVLHQCSETNQTAAHSPDQSEPKFSPLRKTSQTCRGLLIKPKPRLGHSRRPPQPQQVQNTEPAEDFGTDSEGVDTSVCHKTAAEHQPDVQEPVERVVNPLFSNQISSPNDTGSSLGCLTQVIEQLDQHDPPPNVAGSSLSCVTQDASISSTVATQILQSFTIHPDILMQQEPSDPDEPFFILSLTEIPVGPSGEVVGSVPESLHNHPLADASVEQQNIPGESSAAAGDGPLSEVAVPESMEESSVAGLISVNDIEPDPAAYVDWIMENPVDPHESTTVHLSKLPENAEKNDETEICPPKQRGTRRREARVKPNNSKRKQASKTLTTKEAEPIPIPTDTTQQSELPEPSVQPQAAEGFVPEPQTGSGGHVDVEKETRTGGEEPEGSSSGTQTTQTRRTSSRNRKAKDFLSSISEIINTAPASDSLPGKAASKGRKVRALRAAGKRSAPIPKRSAPIPSTSCDDAPTCRVTQRTEKTHSASSTTSPTHIEVKRTSEQSTLYSVTTPSTSLCPAEVSASQHCVESSSMEEEPTNVSQYFLSDIFTEVEEG